MNRWIGIVGLVGIIGCFAINHPPVISDITEDKVKIRMVYNVWETPESFQRRQIEMHQEAQRACNLYGNTKRAISISKICVRFYDITGGGSCKEDEFLYACAN